MPSALDIVLLPRRAHRFGDEHYGAWFLHAKGSGVWYNIGKSITFADHGDAYNHFNAHDNEAMCRAAAAAGFDTIQFTAHPDHVNYPCDSAGIRGRRASQPTAARNLLTHPRPCLALPAPLSRQLPIHEHRDRRGQAARHLPMRHPRQALR